MLRKILILSVVLSAPAATVMAKDLCSVPEAQWRAQAELEADLGAKGWTIAKIKKEDGCYEVYGKNDKGENVEVLIDPVTFAVVGSDE